MTKGRMTIRSEEEILALIIRTAKEDERIRAAIMTGSRANPIAPKDDYQDYDISYHVIDITPFANNMKWIEDHFGKPAIMQMPEDMSLLPHEGHGIFSYLMMFEDGNRIDLSILPGAYKDEGEPAVVLLDKDGLTPRLSSSSDEHWHVRPPTEKHFAECCNEFWWCMGNVGKGIARDEVPYAMKMLNVYVRDMMHRMLEWHVGVETAFSVSTGKFGKYLGTYLPGSLYEKYLSTYPIAEAESMWGSVLALCDLFREAALHVARKRGFNYNQDEDSAMIKYLRWIRLSKG